MDVGCLYSTLWARSVMRLERYCVYMANIWAYWSGRAGDETGQSLRRQGAILVSRIVIPALINSISISANVAQTNFVDLCAQCD